MSSFPTLPPAAPAGAPVLSIPMEGMLRALLQNEELMTLVAGELVCGVRLLTMPEARKLVGVGEDVWKTLLKVMPLVEIGERKYVRLGDLKKVVGNLGRPGGIHLRGGVVQHVEAAQRTAAMERRMARHLSGVSTRGKAVG